VALTTHAVVISTTPAEREAVAALSTGMVVGFTTPPAVGDNGRVVNESELTERVRALRGMDRVLSALVGGPRCYLVGGAVRDLLLGREPVDIDIAVEGDAEAVASRLAEALEGDMIVHERFGTATVVAGGVDVVNLARTRREIYPAPGALPEVEPADLAEDLDRRDFTVNAIALDLTAFAAAGESTGRSRGVTKVALVDPHGGRGDLDSGLIRVLHLASFSDDPTRLLRAARYAARLGFALESDTERWARAAIAGGAPTTVSGPRIRDELIDLLTEDEAPHAVELLRDLGLDRALHPALRADPELIASAKLGAAETGADPALAGLAALAVGARPAPPARPAREGAAARGGGAAPDEAGKRGAAAARAWEATEAEVSLAEVPLVAWIDRLGLASGERDAVLRAAARAPELVDALRREPRPSELRALLDGEPPEALALALALGAPAEPILDFVSRLSMIRLEITGADLLAAGLPESPALGRALDATLARKLDGEVDGRDDELRVALSIARESP
jgi:tRNA nucleotidyltransferase (CCA-adding enzyme)